MIDGTVLSNDKKNKKPRTRDVMSDNQNDRIVCCKNRKFSDIKLRRNVNRLVVGRQDCCLAFARSLPKALMLQTESRQLEKKVKLNYYYFFNSEDK